MMSLCLPRAVAFVGWEERMTAGLPNQRMILAQGIG